MSQENIEIVRAGVDAFVAGDMERVASFYHPDASITVVPDGWPEPAPVEGRDAVLRQFARLQEDWEQHSMEIERELADRDWVVVALRWHTRGASSGISLATTITGAYRLEDARISEARFFWDWTEALRAIGSSD